MKYAILLIIEACLCFSFFFGVEAHAGKRKQQEQQRTGQTGNPTVPPIACPGYLGEGIALLPAHDLDKILAHGEQMKKLNETDKKALTSSVDALVRALQAATRYRYSRDESTVAMRFFVLQLDTIWENNQFVRAKLERIVNQLKKLSPQVIPQWQTQLNKITSLLQSREVTELVTIGFLIQIDRLFAEDGFRKEESERLLTRLQSLSPNAIKGWAKANQCGFSQAAVVLIQHDPLFEQDQFQESLFDKLFQLPKQKEQRN